ncbi:MAG: folate-binding protein, partial [Actinomycetota bacterium]|nr:folate-binding protein [Actinomycetota bacterium]
NLGRPPRRLALVYFSGESDQLPETGAPVELDGRTIGFVGTALHHYQDGPIALVVVKRTLPDGFSVSIAGQTAQEAVLSAHN